VRNRHVRGRLFASAAIFAVYAAVDALRVYGQLSPEFVAQLLLRPLLIALGVINRLIALAVNPWREDRMPDRCREGGGAENAERFLRVDAAARSFESRRNADRRADAQKTGWTKPLLGAALWGLNQRGSRRDGRM